MCILLAFMEFTYKCPSRCPSRSKGCPSTKWVYSWSDGNSGKNVPPGVPLQEENVPPQNEEEFTKCLIKFILKEISLIDKITRQEIADKANISVKTVQRAIKDIPNLKFIGVGRHGHWELYE